MDEPTGGLTNGWIDWQMDGWKMNGLTHGWMNWRMNGWIDGWLNR
jgi:hypothetical protein